MKLFPPTLTKDVVRIFGFALLTTLLISPLVGVGVTVRFSGEPGGEGAVTVCVPDCTFGCD
jgi:hypothetical protein